MMKILLTKISLFTETNKKEKKNNFLTKSQIYYLLWSSPEQQAEISCESYSTTIGIEEKKVSN